MQTQILWKTKGNKDNKPNIEGTVIINGQFEGSFIGDPMTLDAVIANVLATSNKANGSLTLEVPDVK